MAMPATLTIMHIALNLLAISAGFCVEIALLKGRASRGAMTLFWTAAVAANASGFASPPETVRPPHLLFLADLGMLWIAGYSFYRRQLKGSWRPVHVCAVALAHYLLVAVVVVQIFQPLTMLGPFASNQTLLSFLAIQMVVALGFAILTRRAGWGDHLAHASNMEHGSADRRSAGVFPKPRDLTGQSFRLRCEGGGSAQAAAKGVARAVRPRIELNRICPTEAAAAR